jgi:hypothetical protein
LPTSEQLRGLKLDGDYLIWSSDWHNEELSHVLALETRSGKMVGINPDVRLARTAIAICDER